MSSSSLPDRPTYQSFNSILSDLPHQHPSTSQSTESTPLLSSFLPSLPPLTHTMLPRPPGSASFLSCVANLSNTILGTGMLAMAHAFAQGGLILGFLTVIACGLMAGLGLHFLALCAAHPAVPHRAASFCAIAKVTYPKAAVAFDAAIAVKCFGVSISYLLIFGKLMPQVVLSFQSSDPEALSSSILLDRRLWITLSMLVLVPVSFLRTLDSLRYVSYVALVGVIDLIVVAVYKFFETHPVPSGPDQARWLKLDSNFITVLPVFVFA